MDGSFLDLGCQANHSTGTERGAGSVSCSEFSSIPYISLNGNKRKWSMMGGSSLSLCLGGTSCSPDSEGSVTAAYMPISLAKETDGDSPRKVDCDLHLGNEKSLDSKTCTGLNSGELKQKPDVNLDLSLCTRPFESGITSIHQIISSLQTCGAQTADEESTSRHRRSAFVIPPLQILPGQSFLLEEGSRTRDCIVGLDLTSGVNGMPDSLVHQSNSLLQISGAQIADEGTTSRHRRSAIPRPPLQILRGNSLFLKEVPKTKDPIVGPVMPESFVTPTFGLNGQRQPKNRSSSFNICLIQGCDKRARGASQHCISHGGGQRCQKPNFQKGAEGGTANCKGHGGGRRCESFSCTKSAEGRTTFCIRHGGGRRCSHEGCPKAARGKSGLCIGHGGGRRCQMENCTKSAEGVAGLCISHGGGKRCQFIDCTKGAQGKTMFCKKHGGGRRCTYPECTKGAEGSTLLCKAHGGGKRCAFQGDSVCPKSVHGGANFCVSHGGGKRCAFPECPTGARGRTPFCVKHGGGKRCKTRECRKSAQGSTDFCKAHGGGKRCSWGGGSCKSSARGKLGFCPLHSNAVQDKRVHGGNTSLGPLVQDPKRSKSENMKEVVVADEMGSATETLASRTWSIRDYYGAPNANPSVLGGGNPVSAPEGRVRGGNMMAMLMGSSGIGSEPSSSFTTPPGIIACFAPVAIGF